MSDVYERRRQVVYRSPNGGEFAANSDELGQDFSKKVASFDALDGDGAAHQDRGLEPEQYNLDFVFYGADCDLRGAEFEAALAERGAGTLQLPDSPAPVPVQLLSASLTTKLVKDTWRKIYSAKLVKTRLLAAPESVVNQLATTNEYLSYAKKQTGLEFARQLMLDGVSALRKVAAQVQGFALELEKQLNSPSDELLRAVDGLARDALTVVDVAADLLSFPANLQRKVGAKLEQYALLAKSAAQQLERGLVQSFEPKDKRNAVVGYEMQGAVVILGAAAVALDGKYRSREEASVAVARLLALLENYTAVLEGQSYYASSAAVQDAVQVALMQACQYVRRLGFGLKAELVFELQRESSLHELLAQYYPQELARDELAAIDSFIEWNPQLEGLALLEVPSGSIVRVLV